MCAVKKKRTILILKTGQRRDVTERGTKRRRDVRGNVATLQRVGLKTSRR